MEKLRKFETEEQFFNEIETYPQVSLTQDNGKVWITEKPSIIGNFYIRDKTYEFIVGMTWDDFINSEYNLPTECGDDKEFYITYYNYVGKNCINGDIIYDDPNTSDEVQKILPNDLIINDKTYYLQNVPM